LLKIKDDNPSKPLKMLLKIIKFSYEFEMKIKLYEIVDMGVFGTALLPFFQLRSSSTMPNTSSFTNSAFLKYLKEYSTNSTFFMKLLHGGVRGAELEKREQSSAKHPVTDSYSFVARPNESVSQSVFTSRPIPDPQSSHNLCA
jgi:hypothetical protein